VVGAWDSAEEHQEVATGLDDYSLVLLLTWTSQCSSWRSSREMVARDSEERVLLEDAMRLYGQLILKFISALVCTCLLVDTSTLAGLNNVKKLKEYKKETENGEGEVSELEALISPVVSSEGPLQHQSGSVFAGDGEGSLWMGSGWHIQGW